MADVLPFVCPGDKGKLNFLAGFVREYVVFQSALFIVLITSSVTFLVSLKKLKPLQLKRILLIYCY